MEKTSDRFIDKLIVMLTTLWLVSFTVFSTQTWGKYVYLGLTVVIFGLGAIRNGWKVNIAIEPFHLCTMLFLLYGFASYLWAIDGTYTIKRMGFDARCPPVFARFSTRKERSSAHSAGISSSGSAFRSAGEWICSNILKAEYLTHNNT